MIAYPKVPVSDGWFDDGIVRFPPESMFELETVDQSIVIPPRDLSGPLVLEVSYADVPDDIDRSPVGIAVGSQWVVFPAYSERERRCLGVASSGSDLMGTRQKLRIGPLLGPSVVPPDDTWLEIDHVSIEPAVAGECSETPGKAPNWDAELDGPRGLDTYPADHGSFVSGLGVHGSRASKVEITSCLDYAELDAALDVPDFEGAAIDFYWGGTPGTRVTFDFDDVIAVDLDAGTASDLHHARYCLPSYMRGQTHVMAVKPSYGVGSCDGASHAAWVDEVQVVADPECPDTMTGQFEHTPLVGSANASTVVNVAGAHSGAGYLQLDATSCSGQRDTADIVMTQLEVPATGPGPSVTLWSRSVRDPSVTQSFPSPASELGGEGAWAEHVACLDRRAAGRPIVMSATLASSDAPSCSPVTPVAYLAVDDVSLGVNPLCP